MKKGEDSMIALLLAERVILYNDAVGDKKYQFKNVPKTLQSRVKEILVDSGLEFLAVIE